MEGLARDGMTMIVVTHEMGFARRVADRVVFMDEGEIVETAPPEQFFNAPRTERAKLFLGQLLAHWTTGLSFGAKAACWAPLPGSETRI